MITPSKQSFCENTCSCNPGATDAFVIKRHDTCPAMEIDVRGRGNLPVDLTGWEAAATLFYCRRAWSAAADDATTIYLDATTSIKVGDVLRVDGIEDEREKLLVTEVDKIVGLVQVTRGYASTTAAYVEEDAVLVGTRATDVPVEVVMQTVDQQQTEYYQVSAPGGNPDPTIASSKLLVKWREEDTASVGDYYLQIELSNPDTGQKMTLPRASRGFRVRIGLDANDT